MMFFRGMALNRLSRAGVPLGHYSLTHSLTHSLLMPDDGDNDDDDGRLQRAVAHSNRRVQRFITATWRAPPTATYQVVFT